MDTQRQPDQASSGDRESMIAEICRRQAAEVIKHYRTEVRDALLVGGIVYKDLAKRFIPQQLDRSESIAIRVMSLVAKLLLDKEEYTSVVEANHKEGCKRGSRNRRQAMIDGVAVRTRGQVPWSDEEEDRLIEYSDTFLIPEDEPFAGYPDNNRIADMLNEDFHDKRPVRNAGTVRVQRSHCLHFLERDRGLRREKRVENPWNNPEENRDLLALADTIRNAVGAVNIRGRGGPRPGTTNWQAVADELNQRFHFDAWQRGEHVRTPVTCTLAARRLSKKFSSQE